ncbi:hypothetical protein MIMGU_mgv1a002096mg [Erythranthe guttata]|uniref:non-specific serine/threonine protein kinase n=1 Tax=Erythranthe guttata TaxID=4155 RepID=A0A022RXW7_ERYGU|nr:hypothetical protein MIMGU_mgv1a002096mg [Erythranthe guttata]
MMLSFSNLVGEIPDSIGDLVSIKNLDLSQNNLVGRIPESIGRLKNVEQIELFHNKLSGELPDTFSDLTSLLRFDASENNLTGKIPETLAALPLESLHLNDNLLEGEIPEILSSNSVLYSLKLFNNKLTGALPESLGKNSDLELFDVSNNSLEGRLPRNLCHRKNLQSLIIFGNKFSGEIPNSYGECITLTYVRMQENELTGAVPNGIWSFAGLQHLELTSNKLEGSIPPSISSAKGLEQLLISHNKFSGEFPAEICDLEELKKIDLSDNHISGELPSCMNRLTKLQELHMQRNRFTGEIPKGVAAWRELTQLDLSGNQFSGVIPADLGSLPFFLSSLMGNADLCSVDLKPLPPCSRSTNPASSLVLVVVLSTLAFTLVVSLLYLFIKTKKIINFGTSKSKQSWKITSFARIEFNQEDVLASLTDENLIGSGGSGRVYRVGLKGGQAVAVKRLWETRGDSSAEVFCSEIETLGRIKHVNIIRLLFSCINEEYKVLVYDYMENGSLGDALYGDRKGGVLLDWPERFDIAIGAARGLAYLHHDCVPAIVHRDFKSNNILLDEELRPKVADFGLAKVLKHDDLENQVMSRVAGSYGYIAPEYGYTMKVTEKSDVYSFGIVLLELITGRRPNDSLFGENKNIVEWVKEIALSSESGDDSGNGDMACLDELLDVRMNKDTIKYGEVEKVLNVALLCTAELPTSRPSMNRVLELLRGRLPTY